MTKKIHIIANKIDYKLASPEDIGKGLASRLRMQRLVKKWPQQELAERAGLDVGTIKNLESKGQTSLLSLIRIVLALDLVHEFEKLFELKVRSIAEMEAIEKLRSSKIPLRARKSKRDIAR